MASSSAVTSCDRAVYQPTNLLPHHLLTLRLRRLRLPSCPTTCLIYPPTPPHALSWAQFRLIIIINRPGTICYKWKRSLKVQRELWGQLLLRIVNKICVLYLAEWLEHARDKDTYTVGYMCCQKMLLLFVITQR